MKEFCKYKYLFLFILVAGFAGCNHSTVKSTFGNSRHAESPYPLITIDETASAWSVSPLLYGAQLQHPNGKPFPFIGVLHVDGKFYRFMGAGERPAKSWEGKYTFSKPAGEWTSQSFDDSAWLTGKAPFGTPVDYRVNTLWNTPDIWVRREINIGQENINKPLMLHYSHDDIFTLYINGIETVKTSYEWQQDQALELSDTVRKTIQDGKILIAAHCMNKGGGALVDFDIQPEEVASQLAVDVQATQTHCRFACGQVELKLTFTAPLLPDNVELFARPINYISYEITPLDGKTHEIDISFAILNDTTHSDTTEVYKQKGLWYVKTGKIKQKLFEQTQKEWGYFYLCSDTANTSIEQDSSMISITQSFHQAGSFFGKIMAGYDDIYAIQSFGENIRPYWNRNGDKTIEQALTEANRDYRQTIKQCNTFDLRFREYPEFAVYRQTIAAFKVVADKSGNLALVSKDGVTGIMRSSPVFLPFGSRWMKTQLNPLMEYAQSDKWGKAYAPSNMGDYPLLSGQIGSALSPLEATSKMLTLLAMVTASDGNTKYVRKHWQAISQWRQFLNRNKLKAEELDAVSAGNAAYEYMRKKL